MKKVLFLIHDLSYGGAEKVLVNLVNNLDKTKYDVTLQTLFDIGVNKKYLNSDVKYIPGWKHYFPKHTKIMTLFSKSFLSKLIIKDDYDIVISFLEGACSRIVSGYKGNKIAWIHIEHDSTEELAYPFKSINEMNECYGSFDKIVCVSETVKNNFLSLTDLMTECTVLYNVNETEKIIQLSNEKQNTISVLDESKNIISVGRLSMSHKGYDRLIRIHKKLLDNGINNKLYILGEGEDKDKLQKLIAQLNVSDSCKLLGFDENPYKYVSKADLFVCSSHKEGFSTAVTEALILGIPVASTQVSGAKELLGDHNEYGIVTENSEKSLYDGVFRMLTEKDLLSHYKQQAEIRGKKFSTDKTTKAVEEMLENL